MVARKKGDKMGIAWEKKYAEFESYDGMPERGTPLHNLQENQLGNKPASLNAKIRKEIAENKGSTIWSERRVKLSDCVEKKNRAAMGIAWEKKYADHTTGCRRAEPRYTWQSNQLSTGAGSLNAKIKKEVAENEGSTIWSERRVKLFDCISQKRRK